MTSIKLDVYSASDGELKFFLPGDKIAERATLAYNLKPVGELEVDLEQNHGQHTNMVWIQQDNNG